jgi:RibD C-terminal domain
MAFRKGEIADLLNSMRKHVVSSTLTTPLAWSNSRLLAGELATAVTELKQGDGGPILVHGSATLAQALLTPGLVDAFTRHLPNRARVNRACQLVVTAPRRRRRERFIRGVVGVVVARLVGWWCGRGLGGR